MGPIKVPSHCNCRFICKVGGGVGAIFELDFLSASCFDFDELVLSATVGVQFRCRIQHTECEFLRLYIAS